MALFGENYKNQSKKVNKTDFIKGNVTISKATHTIISKEKVQGSYKKNWIKNLSYKKGFSPPHF